ncbi:MAG: septum formation initiator family protein [Acetomicrobium sp.]|jgi:cell division protein FtsB|uniref:septum formation initiator family protein n=1 Tax=Acetomicrobium TaxID=49894 RepID=UPI0016B05964|nr:septum formation initiator family protein [Acetomicrobium mobile]MBP8675372.1 septum formation initiator family protein [Acetomicrobium sp.]MDI9377644.1 septum formation initiator family protein [Synergistota bacterium]NLI43225.1 cell division protein DIVIC [Synergistaceae bacterium]HOB10597.1 septum formation initiator family protein [Acetomicrobium sp.]HOM98021.1 septum formation initiator family protein [Acetomicrobium sp.]
MPRLRWIVISLFSIIVFLMLFNGYIREVKKLNELSNCIDERVRILVQLRLDIEDKSEKIAYYNTAEGIARMARQEFNLVLPGEKIYILEYYTPEENKE